MNKADKAVGILGNQDEVVWDDVGSITVPILGIEDKPKTWYEFLLYSWQHTLVDISPFILPMLVATAAGLSHEAGAEWVSRSLFGMAIATFIMTTIGNRLPIIQGPSASITGSLVSVVGIYGLPAMWGAIFFGAFFEFMVGFSRLVGLLRRLFPAIVSGVVVMSIGFSLSRTAVSWAIGSGDTKTMILIALVTLSVFVLQFLCTNVLGGIISRGAIFFTIWIVGLGIAGVMGMVNWELIASKPWFAFPVLFPEGGPGFGWELSIGAIAGVMVGYLGSVVESLGDYAATCVVSGETYRVRHMNRGIMAEGLGCMVASLFGGIPCTSYTQNIGVISTTRIASRYVVQGAACVLMLYSLCPKFGALLVAVPRPVMGMIFLIVCGSIFMSGLGLVSHAKQTQANSTIVGTSLLTAVLVPIYMSSPAVAQWKGNMPDIVCLLLTNTVVLAVVVGILLNLLLNVLFKAEQREEAANAANQQIGV